MSSSHLAFADRRCMHVYVCARRRPTQGPPHVERSADAVRDVPLRDVPLSRAARELATAAFAFVGAAALRPEVRRSKVETDADVDEAVG